MIVKSITSLRSGWNAWRESRALRSLRADCEAANERIRMLEEELERERVRNRIQQEEINGLAMVIARNHQRVKKEIEDLGGPAARPEAQVLNVAG